MGVGQGVGDLPRDLDSVFDGELLFFGQPGPEGLALHKGHHVEEEAVGLTRIEKRQDAGMVAGCRPRTRCANENASRLIPDGKNNGHGRAPHPSLHCFHPILVLDTDSLVRFRIGAVTETRFRLLAHELTCPDFHSPG